MSEDTKLFIGFCVLVFFIVRGYSRLFKQGNSKKARFISNAKKLGNFTEGKYCDTKIRGEVLGGKTTSNKNSLYMVKYVYKVNGKNYYKNIHYQSPGRISCDYPRTVTVYYNPENPEKAYCVEEIDEGVNKSYGCLFDIFLAILMANIVYAVLNKLF